ncbi:MAG: ATP-binding protein [Brevundimonas sp.]|uniref:ATP-binding protein n=1 Tax=Brevundimonas sp. TaxID=1871086 RepID=UPI004033609B
MTGVTITQAANRENLRLLIMLRWIAVVGQMVTIGVVHQLMHVPLPLEGMLLVLAALVLWNLASMARWRAERPIAGPEVFAGLMVDVLALSLQLYLSGGASNPFVSIFLLQVILGAVLLNVRWAGVLTAATAVAFLVLNFVYRPLDVPNLHEGRYFSLHTIGMFLCFVLTAGLLLIFLARIASNQRDHDLKLAELRRRAVEEDHVVRMGLLATGAAHELGTPLATLSVILNDWKRLEVFRKDSDAHDELQTMGAQLERCKAIVSGILQSSGELRGEGTVKTTVRGFLDQAVEEWRGLRNPPRLDYDNIFAPDLDIVSDVALKQVVTNLLENALEAGADRISLAASRREDQLGIVVKDNGPGFDPAVLERLGQPYVSTKARPGSGLGLFLVANVVRKLGGTVEAGNAADRGAMVTLRLPLAALGAKP